MSLSDSLKSTRPTRPSAPTVRPPPSPPPLLSVLFETGRPIALPGLARLDDADDHAKDAQHARKNLHDENLHEKRPVLRVSQRARGARDADADPRD